MDRPVRLPRADQARIPTDKLTDYALDPSHERGRHKARVFASVLGIRAPDWRYLHDQILEALPDGSVRSTRITSFGVAYEVVVMIDGLNGATAPVVTTWMIESDRPPRLTSIWVDIP
jgi:filamentous hemagglutinin